MTADQITFGPFRLDRDNAVLWRGDERVPLAPKPFEILVVLAERPGELMTKDRLISSVWGGRHVSESSLTVAMNTLRAALGDDPAAPQFIETAPKRGYRFIAPVGSRNLASSDDAAMTLMHKQHRVQSMSALDLPETHYARSGGLNLAYQVMGDGPIDLILVPGLIAHVEFLHELPGYTNFLRRLAGFARVVTFDKSGQGLSDRFLGMPSFEQRVDDVGAIMDAIGSRRAVLLGCSEGGPISMMFTASHPARVSHLILFGSVARFVSAPDYPFRLSEEEIVRGVDQLWVRNWGTGVSIPYFMPSFADNPDVVRQYAKLERLSFSPGALKAMTRHNIEIDVRAILSSIRAPTLVMHRQADLVAVENGRFLASHIPGAKFIEYTDCGDHMIFVGDQLALCGDIEGFVTGHREAAGRDFDRVLATVLFTDIVDSARRAVEMGDLRWRRALDEHDQAARRIVTQHRGKLIKSTGDGILATFDSPARAIHCAFAFQTATRSIGLRARAGLHTGEVELRNGDVAGLAVHAAARVMARANPGEVIVSRLVTDLVAGAGLKFSGRGTHELKGMPGFWELFAASA